MLPRYLVALTLATTCFGIAETGSALGQGNEQQQVALKEKHVLFLPVVNTTGERWEAHKTRLAAAISKNIIDLLSSDNYTFVSDEDMRKHLAVSEFAIDDEESWRRENLYAIGEAVGAEYVIFAQIVHATQKWRDTYFGQLPEGDVTVKFWILNVRTKAPLLNAKPINAKARPKSNFFEEGRGSVCQLDAAGRVARAAIKEAFDLPKKRVKGL